MGEDLRDLLFESGTFFQLEKVQMHRRRWTEKNRIRKWPEGRSYPSWASLSSNSDGFMTNPTSLRRTSTDQRSLTPVRPSLDLDVDFRPIFSNISRCSLVRKHAACFPTPRCGENTERSCLIISNKLRPPVGHGPGTR